MIIKVMMIIFIIITFIIPLVTRGSQSIKIDIGKSFDKSISIDKLNLNDIDFIGQSIKFDTHTPTLSIVSDLSIVIESIKIILFPLMERLIVTL